VLIARFGVYALILQVCERQRKNIAILKVYGAQVKDILMMFFKQYMLQVVIAAAFAFPIGYALMKRWLENYSRQTSVGIEVFLGIFIGMAFLVLLCIGWHVWRAANENPATAVKKE
jgi:ABC-type lipoprotein release transport system permease subunit